MLRPRSPAQPAPELYHRDQQSSTVVPAPSTDQGMTKQGKYTRLDCGDCKYRAKTRSALKKHSARHRREHKCTYPDCLQSKRGFATINDLDRHMKAVHHVNNRNSKLFKCFGKDCTRTHKEWPRLDNFKQHLRKMHSEEPIEHLLLRSNEWYEQRKLAPQQTRDEQLSENHISMTHPSPISAMTNSRSRSTLNQEALPQDCRSNSNDRPKNRSSWNTFGPEHHRVPVERGPSSPAYATFQDSSYNLAVYTSTKLIQTPLALASSQGDYLSVVTDPSAGQNANDYKPGQSSQSGDCQTNGMPELVEPPSSLTGAPNLNSNSRTVSAIDIGLESTAERTGHSTGRIPAWLSLSPLRSAYLLDTTGSMQVSEFPGLGSRGRHHSGDNGTNVQSSHQATDSSASRGDFSPFLSSSSDSDWSENTEDTSLAQFISFSSKLLLVTYLEALIQSHAVQKGGAEANSSKSFAGWSGCQQPARSTSSDSKRKPNDIKDKTDKTGKMICTKRRKKEPEAFDERPLACPFNKYDNTLFGPNSLDNAYSSCATCCFVTIAHLKQHLQHTHYLPSRYCVRCCRSNFSSKADLVVHQRQVPICGVLDPPLHTERITEELIERLKLNKKNVQGKGRVTYWHEIYDTLFPGAAERRAVSPYYEGPNAEFLHGITQFSARTIGDLLPVVRRRMGLQSDFDMETEIQIHIQIQQEILQLYRQHILNAAPRMPRLAHRVVNDSVQGATPATTSRINTPSGESSPITSQTPLPSPSSNRGLQGPQEGLRLPEVADPSSNVTQNNLIARAPFVARDVEAVAEALNFWNAGQYDSHSVWPSDFDIDWEAAVGAHESNYDSWDLQSFTTIE